MGKSNKNFINPQITPIYADLGHGEGKKERQKNGGAGR
jgi:hypothetical protein